jgi:hypothetical protein
LEEFSDWLQGPDRQRDLTYPLLLPLSYVLFMRGVIMARAFNYGVLLPVRPFLSFLLMSCGGY